VDPDLILRLQKYKKLEAVPTPLRQAARAMAAILSAKFTWLSSCGS